MMKRTMNTLWRGAAEVFDNRIPDQMRGRFEPELVELRPIGAHRFDDDPQDDCNLTDGFPFPEAWQESGD